MVRLFLVRSFTCCPQQVSEANGGASDAGGSTEDKDGTALYGTRHGTEKEGKLLAGLYESTAECLYRVSNKQRIKARLSGLEAHLRSHGESSTGDSSCRLRVGRLSLPGPSMPRVVSSGS